MTISVDKSVNNFLEKGLFLTYNTARMSVHRTCYPILRSTSFRLYGVIRISCLRHETVR